MNSHSKYCYLVYRGGDCDCGRRPGVDGLIVYLAGPINGCTDAEANDWRSYMKTRFRETLDPMRRDYRGREDEAVAEIVNGDKADILASDVVVANCPQPSYGTAMEIIYAWEAGKPVVVIAPADKAVSPWLRYHSVTVVHSLTAAVDAVHALPLLPHERGGSNPH